jgi:hypothetical protein
MSDNEYSADKYDTYEKCRQQLNQFMRDNSVSFD